MTDSYPLGSMLAPSWVNGMAPLFFDERGHGRDSATLAQERTILLTGARAWGRDSREADELARGSALALNIAIAVEVCVLKPSPLGSFCWRGYGADSLLALAGKAGAKRFLLDLARQPHGACAPWVKTSGTRIMRQAWLDTLGHMDRPALERSGASGPDLLKTSTCLSDAGQRSYATLDRAGATLVAQLAMPFHIAGLVLWVLDQSLGVPLIEFGSGTLTQLEALESVNSQTRGAAHARAAAFEIKSSLVVLPLNTDQDLHRRPDHRI